MSFAKLVLKVLGWKADNRMGAIPPKAVVIAVPHTSMWDFVYGYYAWRALGVRPKFLIKKESFFFPLGILLRSLGGIPVDRSGKNSVVHDVVEEFKKKDRMILTITPEGTRRPVKRWKNGFHRISKAAGVPLIMGFIDYKTKTAGLLKEYELTDDANRDMLEIMKYYTTFEGKYPDDFYLPPEAKADPKS
jgi:1-acyl-sn-glycerol-3-phosphate acyltransferase